MQNYINCDIPLLPGNGSEIINWLKERTTHFFKSLYFTEVKSVKISSGADPTVRFIGSHLSVLKKYLYKRDFAKNGLFLIQDCIRTHNLNNAFNDDYAPLWGSYFTSLGVLSQYERLVDLVENTYDFLNSSLKINDERIRIRINSKDKDLVNACNRVLSNLNFEFDSRKIEYYRHEIGEDTFNGRNFNIALQNLSDGTFNDVGNIIVLERDSDPFAIEVAIGLNTILQQAYGASHVYDFYTSEAGLKYVKYSLFRKLEDSIIVTIVLFGEGLLPNSSDNKRRILKQYLKLISYYRYKIGINRKELESLIFSYCSILEIVDHKEIAARILSYINEFEDHIVTKKLLSKFDRKIFDTIEDLNNT